jgi:formate/nitrite transporter FocA (FNT family)
MCCALIPNNGMLFCAVRVAVVVDRFSVETVSKQTALSGIVFLLNHAGLLFLALNMLKQTLVLFKSRKKRKKLNTRTRKFFFKGRKCKFMINLRVKWKFSS